MGRLQKGAIQAREGGGGGQGGGLVGQRADGGVHVVGGRVVGGRVAVELQEGSERDMRGGGVISTVLLNTSMSQINKQTCGLKKETRSNPASGIIYN